MLDQETKQRIDTARQILVGKVPNPQTQVEQITTALIYKFMDDMDRENEELGGKAQFFTGNLKEFAWGRLISKELSGQERWDVYTRALDSFSKAKQIPDLFRAIFKGAFLPYRDTETLNLFLKEINGFTYDHSENLGNAFEYLLSVLGSQGDAGQFRTPRHIIDFIVEVIGPQKNERILDPACGTAGFLISSYRHIIRENSSNYSPENYTQGFANAESRDTASVEIQSNGRYKGDKLSPDEKKKLSKNITGYDISPDMVRLSLVNMYLHGFKLPDIFEYDTLTYEDRWKDNFDVILANPPFMSPKGGIRPHKMFRVQANRAEVLFVDYIAEHLTINGRAGIIVPEGIIFQSANAYKALRKMLVEDNYLWAVASLPAGVFNPYSGVKTSILFLDKTIAKKNDEILFVKVSNDGFDLGAQRKRIDKNDLPEAFNVLKKWSAGKKEKSELANWVKIKDVAANGDFNFIGDRYRIVELKGKQKWPFVDLMELCEIESGSRQKGGAVGEGVFSIGGEQISEDNRVRFEKMKYVTESHYQEMRKGKLKKGDVLMVKDGATTGKMGYWDFDYNAAVNEHVYIFRAKDKVLSKYLYRVLWSCEFQKLLKPYIKGIIGGISLEIQTIPIPLPPIEVQQVIIAEIENYQKIIDGAKQVVENWKPKIKVDPDWPIVKLSELINGKPRNGYSGKPVDYETRWKVLSLSATTRGYLEKEYFKYLDEKFDKDFYAICKKGDIYLQRGNTADLVGMPALYNIEDKNYIFPDLMIRIQPNLQKIIASYLHTYLLSDIGRKFVKSNATGAAGSMPKINQTIVENIPVPLPPLETQQQLVSQIESERQSIEEVKKLIEIHERKIKEKIAEVWGE